MPAPRHRLTPDRGVANFAARTATWSSAGAPTEQCRPRHRKAASTIDSTSTCRIISQRLAPMAERTAISERRRAARVSISPATLAQAISSTNSTEANSTRRAGRLVATMLSNSGVTCAAVNLALVFGYCVARLRSIRLRSAVACAGSHRVSGDRWSRQFRRRAASSGDEDRRCRCRSHRQPALPRYPERARPTGRRRFWA